MDEWSDLLAEQSETARHVFFEQEYECRVNEAPDRPSPKSFCRWTCVYTEYNSYTCIAHDMHTQTDTWHMYSYVAMHLQCLVWSLHDTSVRIVAISARVHGTATWPRSNPPPSSGWLRCCPPSRHLAFQRGETGKQQQESWWCDWAGRVWWFQVFGDVEMVTQMPGWCVLDFGG